MATILIVDDRSVNRKYLVTLLQSQRHRLVEAVDGREGLAAVHAEHPDLVITDVLMPVMDGYEFVRQLRIDPSTSQIPVVFYTANYAGREARALARSIGVSYVLTKPAGAEEVLRVVGRVLSGEPDAFVPLSAAAFDHQHLRLMTDKLSEKAADVRTANARLRAIINISLEIASERDPDRLLENVCIAARDLFGATYVTLGILDLTDRTVQRFSSAGDDVSGWIKTGDSVSGILGSVVAERRTWRGDTRGGDPAALPFPTRHPEVQAFLAAPIASPAHVYGWICFVGNEGRTFSQDDEDLVMALSGQVGRIYENSHFHAVAQARTGALEAEIGERKQADAALRHERDRAQQYLDTAEVLLISLDREMRVMLANRYACAVLGWTESELLGRDWAETCLPAQIRDTVRARLAGVLAGGRLSAAENPVLTRSGGERLIAWRNTVLRDEAGGVIGTFSSGTDITERRALEAEYRQAQKMEAIGRLAGGVAHDFNNLLTVILGHCDLLLDDLVPADPCHARVLEIQKAGGRGAGLTRQLLDFSRKQVIEPTLIDLTAVVGELQGMFDRLIGDEVRVALQLQPVALVKADRGQVEQIILNLAVNARDAMPEGGTLTLETVNVEIDEPYAKRHLSVPAGPYVVLTVTDSGHGMTPQVQARVFEPFFTTKELGQGTGLGLATVQGIVARAGGCVNVHSEVGKGTSFKVYFPCAAAEEPAVEAPLPPVSRPAGAATVLLVEDTDGLREVATRLLQRQGYAVVAAANADEALDQFAAHPEIALLLTDVVMAGASGPELSGQLVQQRPELKVIYMSGYSEEAVIHHGLLSPGIAFLHKPFTAESLGAKIREVLDAEVVRAPEV